LDVSKLRAQATIHRNFCGRPGRQVDAGDGSTAIEQAERRFETGADRRFVVRERDAAIDVVGCKASPSAELKGAHRLVVSGSDADRSVGCKAGAGTKIDRTG
jgi:hypothetical protein